MLRVFLKYLPLTLGKVLHSKSHCKSNLLTEFHAKLTSYNSKINDTKFDQHKLLLNMPPIPIENCKN